MGAAAAGWRILRVDHVGIAVADLDAALALHTRVLGLVERHRETNTDQGVVEVMLGASDGSGETLVQLLGPARADSPIARFLDRHGPGLQQLAYTVDDVLAATAELRALGVRMLYDEPRAGTSGSLVNFVHPKHAGGVLVELVQPVPA